MRSLLFVPADSERKLEKALASGADVLILDLEDSVSADAKPRAREIATAFLRAKGGSAPTLFVRINDLRSGLADADLDAVMAAGPAGIMLPKCEGPDDVMALAMRLRVREADNGLEDGVTRILPIITETARGVLHASHFDRPLPRLAGLTWGAEDLSAAIGARAARDEAGRFTHLFDMARSLTLLAASASDTAAIDTVYPDFRDEAGFLRSCEDGERDGFTARMAIHPAQVEVINRVFTPSPEAIAAAQAVVDAFASHGDAGVVAIEGKMYDRPHLRAAQRLLARSTSA